MKMVFFGTPDYVVPILERLDKTFQTKKGESPIVAVVTQPPRPAGRKQKLEYSPVDSWAHKKKIPVFYDSHELIKVGIEAEVAIVASYGAIIPKEIITHFSYGILNIHPSLLPRYRGASPVQATLVCQEKETGATIIKIDELMDHGPVVSQFTEDVKYEDTSQSLRTRLFERASEVLSGLLPSYLSGKVITKEQDHDKAIYTKTIKKDDAFIPPKFLSAVLQGKSLKKDWQIPFITDFITYPTPSTIHNFVRAMEPWPIAWSKVSGSWPEEKRIKILKAHLESEPITKLVLDEVQLEGKSPVSWKQFKEAYPKAKFE